MTGNLWNALFCQASSLVRWRQVDVNITFEILIAIGVESVRSIGDHVCCVVVH